jgi:hypothetical protein
MKSEKLIAVLCGGIMCLAIPLYWQQITSVADYWSAGQSAAPPFSADSDTKNKLIVGALCASTLMAPIALAGLALQGFEKFKMLSFVLSLLAIASLLCFVVCQLVLYNQYGGAGRHLGQTSMAIHSGTTFCIVSLFVIYRFFESRSASSSHGPLFEKQLVVMCLGPFLYRVAYGLWFLILGHESDGIWGQQVILAFGYFLFPMLAIYVGTYLYRMQAMPRSHAMAISGAILLLILIGLVGYNGSDVQPALVYHDRSHCSGT